MEIADLDRTAYAIKIDSLREKGLLQKSSFGAKSKCGGAVDGYYFNGELVYIEATNGGELSFQRRIIYLNEKSITDIIYQPYVTYDNRTSNKTPDFSILDTTYQIQFRPETVFNKYYSGEVLSKNVDSALLSKLISCGGIMLSELQKK
ncbi:hypothetical protein AAU57_01760 [Nonlabens sp. YIK11]|uniref:hypothetical protein n=1 Tax=Nonlabens sp. YIK11 TaxID=1453349 RepID=UPI0006DCBEEC|nr:hypothetical protein [Nonlabens sp. YIK11]KQC32187.1 hypothetical protein AAU57_01760 [Nonlabens sp. YIK11]